MSCQRQIVNRSFVVSSTTSSSTFSSAPLSSSSSSSSPDSRRRTLGRTARRVTLTPPRHLWPLTACSPVWLLAPAPDAPWIGRARPAAAPGSSSVRDVAHTAPGRGRRLPRPAARARRWCCEEDVVSLAARRVGVPSQPEVVSCFAASVGSAGRRPAAAGLPADRPRSPAGSTGHDLMTGREKGHLTLEGAHGLEEMGWPACY